MIAALVLAAKIVVVNPDDMMDHPQPKAPIAQWTQAPGRKTIELFVQGAILRGYSYTGKVAAGPVLLMFGGSGNLIKNHDAAARGFARNASRVVFYDYRGYGFSSGVAHFGDLRSDAVRIYDATLAGSSVKRVVVLGYSMGTDIAEYVATQRNVAGLILAAPWSDAAKMWVFGDTSHSVYRFSAAAKQAFDEPAMVRQIRAPLLVFQGTRDDGIPPNQGRQLEREAASPDKRFVAIAGAKHNGLLENPQSQAAVAVFLQHVANL
jgi:pimeloyl-ACP methyl ester carboxylesterase